MSINSLRMFRGAACAGLMSMLAACSTAPKPAPVAAVTATALNMAGNWLITTETPAGPIEQKMSVIQTGKDLKGMLESPMGSSDYTGTVDGTHVRFGFNFNAQGTDLRIDFVGTTDGSTMNGKATFGSFGDGAFKGRKL